MHYRGTVLANDHIIIVIYRPNLNDHVVGL